MKLSIDRTVDYSSLETGVSLAERYRRHHYSGEFAIEWQQSLHMSISSANLQPQRLAASCQSD